MVQIIEYYLKQPISVLKDKMGLYVNYINQEKLKLSDYGQTIVERIEDEN